MGDLPAAGLYWSLTERDLPAAVEQAMNERFASAHQVLRALPARPPVDRYPERAQERLRGLISGAKDEGYVWEPKIRKMVGKPRRGGWWVLPATLALLFLTVGIWILGWIFLVTRVL
jgi:hypothetical protein